MMLGYVRKTERKNGRENKEMKGNQRRRNNKELKIKEQELIGSELTEMKKEQQNRLWKRKK